MPTVSVIVPVYNVKNYLRRCVDSILSQTFTDFELLLIDDGSNDGSSEICDEYAINDGRVITKHQTNAGAASARNKGLELAKGRYICFCDSDDYFDTELLCICIDSIENNDADAVVFSFEAKDQDNHDVSRCFRCEDMLVDLETWENKYDYLLKYLLTYKVPWSQWSGFYKSDIIKRNQIWFEDAKIVFAEDMLFSCEYALRATRILCTSKILYHYTIRNDSITGTTSAIKLNEINNLSFSLFNRIKNEFIKQQFFNIHARIIDNRLSRIPFSVKNIRKMNKLFHEIERRDYFIDNNYKYFKAIYSARKNYDYNEWINEVVFRKFLYQQNILVTYFDIVFLKLSCFAHSLYKKLKNILTKEKDKI